MPKVKLDTGKLIQCLQAQNPAVPMNDWAVIKTEEPQKNSNSFLLLINEESLEMLEKNDNRLRFGIRYAKLKIFRNPSPGEDPPSPEEDPPNLDELVESLRLEEESAKDGAQGTSADA